MGGGWGGEGRWISLSCCRVFVSGRDLRRDIEAFWVRERFGSGSGRGRWERLGDGGGRGGRGWAKGGESSSCGKDAWWGFFIAESK